MPIAPVVFELFENAGETALAEFRQWFEAADAMKALRNDYVHGRWGVPGKLVDGQPLLAFVPLHWGTRWAGTRARK